MRPLHGDIIEDNIEKFSPWKIWLIILAVYGIIFIILTAMAFSICTVLMENIIFRGYFFISMFMIVLIAQKAYVELKAEQD